MDKTQDIEFEVDIKHSSWVAMRILPSSHTNPIFVLVGGKPIRASRKSVEWCLNRRRAMLVAESRSSSRTDETGAGPKADYELRANDGYQRLLA